MHKLNRRVESRRNRNTVYLLWWHRSNLIQHSTPHSIFNTSFNVQSYSTFNPTLNILSHIQYSTPHLMFNLIQHSIPHSIFNLTFEYSTPHSMFNPIFNIQPLILYSILFNIQPHIQNSSSFSMFNLIQPYSTPPLPPLFLPNVTTLNLLQVSIPTKSRMASTPLHTTNTRVTILEMPVQLQ